MTQNEEKNIRIANNDDLNFFALLTSMHLQELSVISNTNLADLESAAK